MKLLIFAMLIVAVSGGGETKSCNESVRVKDFECMELEECLQMNLPVPLRTYDCIGGDNVICCLWNVNEDD